MSQELNLPAIRQSSLTPGLQDLGSVTSVFSYSGTIPIGSIVTTTFDIPFLKNDVISTIRVNVAGHHAGQYWFPLQGALGILDGTISGASISSAYYTFMQVQSYASGRRINVQFVNQTVGSVVTIPPLTFTFVSHLYNYPW